MNLPEHHDAALDIVTLIEQRGGKVEAKGKGWMVQCPAHPDGRPSLSIDRGDSSALMMCFAHCSTDDILAALDLPKAFVYDNPKKGVEYRYSDGRVVHRQYNAKKDESKHFWQDGNVKGVALYVPPQINLAAALTEGRTVYITEGEKDANVLAERDMVAVTNAMGTSWDKSDWSILKGESPIIVIADNDEPGMKRARDLYFHMQSIVGKDKVYAARPKEGKDFTDHILSGHLIRDLVKIDFLPVVGIPDAGTRKIRLEDSDVPLLPQSWVWREIIPAGALTIFAGQGGCRKSTFVVWLTAQLQRGALRGRMLDKEARILMLSTEDDWASITVPRFKVNDGQVGSPHFFKRVHVDLYVDGKGKSVATIPKVPMDLDGLRETIIENKVDIVVIDPLISMLEDGKSIDSIVDARSVCDPLNALATELKVSIIGIMHTNKNTAASMSHRLSGSTGWRDASRALLLFAKDPDEENTSVITVDKMNGGREGINYSFTADTVTMRFDAPDDEGNYDVGVQHVTWNGECDHSVADAYAAEREKESSGELSNMIVDYLRQRNTVVEAKEVIKEMKESTGALPATVTRTLSRLSKRPSGRVISHGYGKYSFRGGEVTAPDPQAVTTPTTRKCWDCGMEMAPADVANGWTIHPACERKRRQA